MRLRTLTPILLVCLLALSVVVLDGMLDAFTRPAPDALGRHGRDRPSILLVTIDTLRADHVGSYGYPNARTHHLDALAARGVRFQVVRSPSRFTGPAHISLMTGLKPERHGVVRNGRRLRETVPTLVEPLRRVGYETAAFVGGWTTSDHASGLPSRFEDHGDVFRPAPWLPRDGLATPIAFLFDRVSHRLGIDPNPPQRPATAVNAEALTWLEGVQSTPFFVWVHYFDPHLPYSTPTGQSLWYQLDADARAEIVRDADALDHMRAGYDAEIAIADEALGALLESSMRAAGRGGLVTVVTSDHGESMGEHGLYWERDLYEETQRVPLVIAGEGVQLPPGSVVEAPATLVDVAPTILELVGIAPEQGFDGRSWAGHLRGGTDPPVVSHISRLEPEAGEQMAISVNDGRFKLIRRDPGWRGHYWAPGSLELYDLKRDPHERENLAEHDTKRVEELERRAGPRAPAPPAAVSPGPTTESDAEMLRSLGYAD